MATSSIERLAWDSEFFGLPIGSATAPRLDDGGARDLLAEAERLGLTCLYLRTAADDEATITAAERHGFHLVDVRVVVEKAPVLPAAAMRAGATIEPASPDEVPRLQDIAAEIAPRSRYAFDPGFGIAEAVRLYRKWIENSCCGFADAVLVSRDSPGGVATGFVACTLRDGVAGIQLIGVHSTARRRGVSRALFHGTIDWAAKQGARLVEMVTQAHNVPAQRAAQSVGFLTRDVSLVYHRWLLAPPRRG
jgi:RimJ/RimL family protein N-acetyltransferase